MKLIAVWAAVCCLSASAQVSVVETGTRAHLVDGVTTITVALRNRLDKPVAAQLQLKWVSPDDKSTGLTKTSIEVPAGDTTVDVAMPLTAKMKPLSARLVYEVTPEYANLTAFPAVRGALSFPNIADYAFTVRVIGPVMALPGEPYEATFLTTNLVTGAPVAGVKIEAGKKTVVSDANGVATLKIVQTDNESASDVEISARMGDLEEGVEMRDVGMNRANVRIQLDKPIYQAGQMMHVRLLAMGANGRAQAGVVHQIKIENEDEDLEFSAKVTTSRFGIASADWAIPANVKSGEYRIVVANSDEGQETQQQVTIRPYELPTFRVVAHPERSYYLRHERAEIEVRAEYLFGKPVATGKVRIVEGEKDFADGTLDSTGVFRTSFLVGDEITKAMRYSDRHFTAFVTDSSTNRTEQQKFDVRVSLDRLHIYLDKRDSVPDGQRLYVAVNTPDGKPVKGPVEVFSQGRLIARQETNRFGVVRLDVGKISGDIRIRAKDLTGNQAESLETLYESEKPAFWMSTDKRLYKTGEEVRCEIVSRMKGLSYQVLALDKPSHVAFSKSVRMSGTTETVAIPYLAGVGQQLSIVVVAAQIRQTVSRMVLFPGSAALQIKGSPVQSTYRPGEMAQIKFEASEGAALGVAIVDQSVIERANTDDLFGHRGWFGSYVSDGTGDEDLLNMDPSRIDKDVELLAEARVQDGGYLADWLDESQNEAEVAYTSAIRQELQPFRARLDELYIGGLWYPRDQVDYAGLRNTLLDPWMQPFYARFGVAGPDEVMDVCSSGPDKKADTDDDFCALSVARKWFAPAEALMRSALGPLVDYPESVAGVLKVLEQAGIGFQARKDPWQTPLRLTVSTEGNRRVVRVISAGADKRFGTKDDFRVCEFTGSYFSRVGQMIQKKIDSGKGLPTTEKELSELARDAGVDPRQLIDPWGHGYYLVQNTDAKYYDKVTFYSYQVFGAPTETRKQLVPGRQVAFISEIRSAGPDGKRGTYDDFTVYVLTKLTEGQTPGEKAGTGKTTNELMPPGSGVLTGRVTDPSGASIPGAEVTVDSKYTTKTDNRGMFVFAQVPQGVYSLEFNSPGFMRAMVANVPVKEHVVTEWNQVLNVGNVTETVEVSASLMPSQTSSSEISSVQVSNMPLLSTPRVREYFPETLYWQPELVTDSEGRASVEVKLADTITNWHVAVIASTEDGKVSETETSIRAFQPFQVDLDLPKVLTAGDQISLPVPVRNYLEQSEVVSVKATATAGLRLEGEPKQPGLIAKNSSVNAVMQLRADSSADEAKLEVSAIGKTDSDAISKAVKIHPDGERREASVTNILEGAEGLEIDLPGGAVAGSVKAEVKVYPSLMARLLEAAEAQLKKPYGCGEQTISSSYPNLLVLRALKQAGLEDKEIEAKALKNLQTGYERLKGYQDDDGGFKYWSHSKPDVALTVYALRFLRELKAFVRVDDEVIGNAQKWLGKQDTKDLLVHAYSMQALVEAGANDAVLKELTKLAQNAAAFEDPYQMAAFASAAMDAKKPELAEPTMRRLKEMAQDERGAAFWALRANTPFHGWGRWGQIETTSMVLSAMIRWQKQRSAGSDLDFATLINRTVMFLLRNCALDGGWGSGQATVLALTALLEHTRGTQTDGQPVEVLVNGSVVGKVAVLQGRTLAGPERMDVSRFMQAGKNLVSVRNNGGKPVETQFNAAWFEKWSADRKAKEFLLETKFSSASVKVNEAVSCAVRISRPEFRGYGMMIAEVGLPPGAEVDRGSLEAVLGDARSGVDSYEVAPDHVTFYVWPRAADAVFHFTFRPRFAMDVKMAESELWDYYNPDARAVLVPGEFRVR